MRLLVVITLNTIQRKRVNSIEIYDKSLKVLALSTYWESCLLIFLIFQEWSAVKDFKLRLTCRLMVKSFGFIYILGECITLFMISEVVGREGF